MNIIVTSGHTSSERKLQLDWTVPELKGRFYAVTGIPPGSQQLHLYAGQSANQAVELYGDQRTLAEFKPSEMARIHVTDTRPANAQEITSDDEVEHFRLTDEQYQEREDSVLRWKQREKLGRFDSMRPAEVDRLTQTMDDIAARGIAIGVRCAVGHRRGEVRFIGPVDGLPGGGVWIGVAFDEPVGKNDGCVNGTPVFEAKPMHGAFFRHARILLGDPESEELGSDFDEM